MGIYIAAAVIFGLAFLGLAVSTIRKKHCLGCSCEAARQIMEGSEATGEEACGRDLVHLE